MKLQANKFKQALANNDTVYGLWMGIPNTTVAEIGAGAGFDWVLIDGEHAPFELSSIQTHLQAIAPYDVSPIVRPGEGQTAWLKQLLDIGVQSFLIPMVETREQTEQLVQAVNYPPKGIRGLGTSMARAANWNRIENYAQQANNEICLIVQIETQLGMQNLEEIAAVDGVDGVFIGPSDLSASMGYLGQPNHPEVVAAIKDAFNQIQKAGKSAGILAMTKQSVQDYVEAGACFVGVGVDAALLVNATQKLAGDFIESSKDKDDVSY